MRDAKERRVRPRRKGTKAQIAELQRLAERCGIETAYVDMAGQRHEVSPDSLLAVIQLFGIPIKKLKEIPDALRERQQQNCTRVVEPVTVAWGGGPARVELRLPADESTGPLECSLTLEDRQTLRWTNHGEQPEIARETVNGVTYVVKGLELRQPMPCGYHQLAVEGRGGRHETLIIAAPNRAYTPNGHGWERSWGPFLPLYAIHSQESWGAGDFGDLRRLVEWSQQHGAGFVATLPLLAAFLDEPLEPSPYSPVSRLFWNEFYVNVPDVPRVAHLDVGPFQPDGDELTVLRAEALVDYRRVMALKRKALSKMAYGFFSMPTVDRSRFDRHVASHPYLDDYAKFRAVGERQRRPWPEWPEKLRDGMVEDEDFDDEVRRYHLFVQWVASEQLGEVACNAKQAGPGLYVDLPLGVHANGYDIWRERAAFAVGVAGGAPPDVVFPKGQNWGFVPLHPEGIRAQGYRYVRAYLKELMRFAGILRIDHVPSLHRVFWIPPGMEAADGVYVRYPKDELYALYCLEAQRHQTLLAGEDLGTVPPEVSSTMARHGIHRTYVIEYELQPDPTLPLPEPAAASIASVNTHDMPPFEAYIEGKDITERLELGLISQEQSSEANKARHAACQALVAFMRAEGRLGAHADGMEVYRAALGFLRDSPARLMLVNLEDLWQETASQNIPSTGNECPNWRRKTRLSFEEFTQKPEVLQLLRELAQAFPAHVRDQA